MGTTPRPEAVREPEEVLLVDRVEHGCRRPLNDLVLQGRDRQWTLLSVRLRYIDPPRRQRPIRSSMDTGVQVLKVAPEILPVVPPRHPVDARRGMFFERKE